jgi:serine/threonine protein phosphatase PrpC
MSASDVGPRRRRSRRDRAPQDSAKPGPHGGPFDVDIDIPSLSGNTEPPSDKVGILTPSARSVAFNTPEEDLSKSSAGPSVAAPVAAQAAPAQPIPPPAVSEIYGPVQVAQIVIGTPSPDVEPVPTNPRFRDFPFRPDTVVEGWSNDVVTVRGASLRGHVHRHNGAPRQDDFAVHVLPDGRLVALVADGVSSAKQSHLGATMAVRQATQWLKTQMPPLTAETDWMALTRDAAYALVNQAQAMLHLPDPPDVLTAEKEMATTLLCAVIEQAQEGILRAHVVGVGDSGAWLLREGVFTPVLGGKAADESGISSNAVAGLPRLPSALEAYVIEIEVGDVLLLGTDGFGDPLGTGEGGVGNLFRELFARARPPSLLEFAHALDFSRETFDDDRTLVAVMPLPPREPRESATTASRTLLGNDL